MPTCDICASSTTWDAGTTYSPDEFREMVAKGFVSNGPAVSMLSTLMSREAAIDHWKKELGEKSATPWLVCPTCAVKTGKFLQKAPGSGPGGAKLDEVILAKLPAAVSKTPAARKSPETIIAERRAAEKVESLMRRFAEAAKGNIVSKFDPRQFEPAYNTLKSNFPLKKDPNRAAAIRKADAETAAYNEAVERELAAHYRVGARVAKYGLVCVVTIVLVVAAALVHWIVGLGIPDGGFYPIAAGLVLTTSAAYIFARMKFDPGAGRLIGEPKGYFVPADKSATHHCVGCGFILTTKAERERSQEKGFREATHYLQWQQAQPKFNMPGMIQAVSPFRDVAEITLDLAQMVYRGGMRCPKCELSFCVCCVSLSPDKDAYCPDCHEVLTAN